MFILKQRKYVSLTEYVFMGEVTISNRNLFIRCAANRKHENKRVIFTY